MRVRRGRRWVGWLLPLFVTLALMCWAACRPTPPPSPNTAPWLIYFDVWGGANRKVPGARIEVEVGADIAHLALVADNEGNVTARVPPALVMSHVWVTADGYRPYDAHLPTADCRTADGSPCGASLSDGARISINLVPLAPPTPRLHVEGRRFLRPDGSAWYWRGLTAFRLAEMVARGREAEVDAFFAWSQAHGVTIARVLTAKALEAGRYFELSAEDGRNALPRVLQLAADHGIYVEAVGLVDTALRRYDHAAHIRTIGAVCAAAPNCMVQIANEPVHSTQDPRLADVAYLRSLRALVPREVLTTLGPRHGSDDGHAAFVGGDYVTVHFDRADGDGGWRWVRHIREGWDLSVGAGQPLINDEPRRDDLQPDKHFAVGAECGMLGLGDTFHYGDGIQGKPPTSAADAAAFEGRRAGWVAMDGWTGLYYTVESTPASPLASADFSRMLRVWASVNGGAGRALAIRVSGEPIIGWRAPWRPTRHSTYGAVHVWELAR